MNSTCIRFLPAFLTCFILVTLPVSKGWSQAPVSSLSFSVSMPDPKSHYFQVELNCSGIAMDTISFKMPVWMPGYYQVLNYSANVEKFSVEDKSGKKLAWEKTAPSTWRVISKRSDALIVRYSVKAVKSFVAESLLDEEHGYISPAGLFIYPDGYLDHPSSVAITPYPSWNRIATGLDSVVERKNYYTAASFDQLYDSPILIGKLEELPPFTIRGIRHRFIGFKLGSFDRLKFMDELKKAVDVAVGVIGEIPYNQYTFIAIGPGKGGIEHLNSTSFGFDGNDLNSPQGRQHTLSFLSHEYFHHYNVKRIRPVELGPFDYQKENRTNSLWISEGLSVYYEFMMLKRAKLITKDALLKTFQKTAASYENRIGRLYQSLVQASYETWADGPFGRTGDEENKSISYYDKGAVMGMLLDLAIRNASANKKSLDDVMKLLYADYYKKKKRGFTEAEFQEACEKTAGKSLGGFFEYIYTVKAVDYNKYLAFGGLEMEVNKLNATGASFAIKDLPGATKLQKEIQKAWLGE